jgi:hypothetical protein
VWNSKPKQFRHRCGKHKRGNPKVGHGICHQGYRDAVIERIKGKRLIQEWMWLIKLGLEANDIEL